MQTALHHGLHHATHTYNAMPKLHHRDPGGLAALLLSEQVRCELIADTIHVHPAMMQLLYRLKGENGVILITDAMRAAGMPDGLYHLGRYEVTLRDGHATLTDGTLAGSVLTMDKALVNFASALNEPLLHLWRVSSLNAACAIGIDDQYGSIAPGKVADLVLLQPEASHTVLMTLRGGKIIYSREGENRQ
jgi:N-acetylglucosamine-6-phosphate deacetylase